MLRQCDFKQHPFQTHDLIQVKYISGLPDSNFSSFYGVGGSVSSSFGLIMMDLIWQVMPMLQERAGCCKEHCFPERCQMWSVLLPSCYVSVKVIFNFDI